jgi:hypothetical protein
MRNGERYLEELLHCRDENVPVSRNVERRGDYSSAIVDDEIRINRDDPMKSV